MEFFSRKADDEFYPLSLSSPLRFPSMIYDFPLPVALATKT